MVYKRKKSVKDNILSTLNSSDINIRKGVD